jgi:hypothetical protein
MYGYGLSSPLGSLRERGSWFQPFSYVPFSRVSAALWLAITVAWLAISAFAEVPSHQPAETSGATIMFDIPAQPLASALKAYAAAASIQLFYDTDLMLRRQSSSVDGLLTPDAALHTLLQGTGLSAVSFDRGTVTILAGPGRAVPVDLEPAKVRAIPFMPYFALMQSGLRSALCRSPATRLDPSERRIRLWITSSGTVARAELLTPTGSAERDRAYVDALQTLSIDEPPPASMPQPITLAILPRTSPDAAECSTAGEPIPVRPSSHE